MSETESGHLGWLQLEDGQPFLRSAGVGLGALFGNVAPGLGSAGDCVAESTSTVLPGIAVANNILVSAGMTSTAVSSISQDPSKGISGKRPIN